MKEPGLKINKIQTDISLNGCVFEGDAFVGHVVYYLKKNYDKIIDYTFLDYATTNVIEQYRTVETKSDKDFFH